MKIMYIQYILTLLWREMQAGNAVTITIKGVTPVESGVGEGKLTYDCIPN